MFRTVRVVRPMAVALTMITVLSGPQTHAEEISPAALWQQRLWHPGLLKTSDLLPTVEHRLVPIILNGGEGHAGHPLTFGVPLAKGEVHRASDMRVINAQGQPVRASITPTATWTPGGALKWVLIDTTVPPENDSLRLEYGSKVGAMQAAPLAPLYSDVTDQTITIDTGRLRVAFSRTRGTLFDRIELDGKVVLDAGAGDGGLYFVDQDDRTFRSAGEDKDYHVEVEFVTPMRVVVKATGWYVGEGGDRANQYVMRVYLYRDQPMVRVFTTWLVSVNTDTMQWREIGVRMPVKAAGAGASVLMGTDGKDVDQHIRAVIGPQPIVAAQTAIRTGVIRQGDKQLATGKHIGGWLDVDMPGVGGVTLASPDLAGHFPSGLAARDGGLTLHAFTPDAGHLLGFRRQDIRERYGEEMWAYFEKQRHKDPVIENRRSQGQGIAKTHEFTLTFRPARAAEDRAPGLAAAAATLRPPLAMASPEWNCASGAFGPYHPYDEQKFPEHERRVSDALDEWLHVTSHMNPHYGFYDHGRGIPHHIVKRVAPDGEDEFIYSGYRRNYDLGYGNGIVPWLMYLRSGDRRWLNAGTAIANHEMDLRHIHPTVPDAFARVGYKFWHYGSWSFDGSCLGFQDHWYRNLLLCYYTTGYQRAMDVFGEVMESSYDYYMVEKKQDPFNPDDRTGRTSMAGSVAAYYKATWDERFRALHAALTPSVLATQREDGTYPIRIPWMEQFFQESLFDMPDPLPEIVAAYEHYTDAHVRVPERCDQQQFASFAYWWHHHRHSDPIVAAFAQAELGRYKGERFNLIGNFGMRELLYFPQWQLVSLVPGHETAAIPTEITLSQPGFRPIVIQHTQGKRTWLSLSYLGDRVEAFDEAGKPLPDGMLTYDGRTILYVLSIPATHPTGRVTIRCTASERLDRKGGMALLPWFPDRDRVLIRYEGENPLVDTPVAPAPVSWQLPAGEDPLLPSGRFGNGVRLSEAQQVIIDLGETLGSEHVRQGFDSRQGTIEFWIRFESEQFGNVLEIPIEGGKNKWQAYERTLWVRLASLWDARMYNNLGERLLISYRQTPRVIPGQWHHVVIMWDWDDRDNGKGKRFQRMYLDGWGGATVYPGEAADSRTYWTNTAKLPSPGKTLIMGERKIKSAVTIDELRISKVMRYPYVKITEHAFEPPTSPFVADEDTVLLHHFDGQENAISTGGKALQVEFVRTKAK